MVEQFDTDFRWLAAPNRIRALLRPRQSLLIDPSVPPPPQPRRRRKHVMLHKLRIALAVTVVTLATLSTVDSASAGSALGPLGPGAPGSASAWSFMILPYIEQDAVFRSP
jgi:hypothetical protein